MEARFYRQWVNTKDLIKIHIDIEETDLLILSKTPLDLNLLERTVRHLRQDIKDYIAKDRRFADSLKPISIQLGSAAIIRLMADAASKANVGPMAAVAGGISQLLAEELAKQGYKELIIENGGDIFMSKQTRSRGVAIFAGGSRFSGKLILQVDPQQTPCGICTSSATFGHSLSFGKADSVVILAKDAALADAVATATCNSIHSAADFKNAIEFASDITGVFGTLIILNDNLASWGDIQIQK